MELFFLALLVLIMASALGSGYPVAFALPGSAIITIILASLSGLIFAGDADAYFHSGGLSEWLTAGVTNLRGIYWEVERDTLIAIPLFIFMGIMLQRSKIAEDLLVAMAQLFGPVPGGLGISVVFVGALLAATTGILGATVVAMGMISLPAMLRNNYSKPLAAGTIAASGTLGQIIPPSIVLIILADQLASATDQASTARKALYKSTTGELSMPSAFDVTSTSAGEMFLGAFIPGMLLVGLYMTYILVQAILRPETAPAVPFDIKPNLKVILKLLLTLVSPLALIFIVLGSIIGGIATVNQAGAIGAAGAVVMAGYRLKEGDRNTFYPAILMIIALAIATYALMNYEMNFKGAQTAEDTTGLRIGLFATALLTISLIWSGWRTHKINNTLGEVMLETVKTTSLVFIILLGAAMLTAAFRAFGGEELVRNFLEGLPGGFWMKFTIVMGVIFLLGFFLDYIEIAVVVVPIVAPILLADPTANITAVWLGVMIGLNIQTSFLTPPFGFALFYLRGVAPAVVKTLDMYKGVIPFIVLQLIALGIVGFYPQLVNYLPNRVSFLSETAPPPRNPKLQYCLEQYVAEKFDTNGDQIRAAISSANALNLSYLPSDVATPLRDAISLTEQSFAKMIAIQKAEQETQQASIDYAPIRRIARHLQKSIRGFEEDKRVAQTARSRARGDQSVIDNAERQIALFDVEIENLTRQIPANWDETHSVFAEFTKREQAARQDYRRSADRSSVAINDALVLASDGENFASLRAVLAALLETPTAALNQEGIKAAESKIRAVAGTCRLLAKLKDARKALKGSNSDPAKAASHLRAAMAEFEADLGWRTRAYKELKQPLATFQQALSGTIGLRVQDTMTREQALFVAACNSNHRNIGLNF